MRTAKVLIALAVGLFFCASSRAVDLKQDLTKKQYLFGGNMGYPLRKIEKVFPASRKNAYFTAFENLKDVALKDGRLTFTLTAAEGRLGWGNYKGRQAVEDVQDTFQEAGEVAVKIKQSSGKSTWSIYFHRDGGRPLSKRTITKTATGNGWQELAFADPRPGRVGIPVADAKFDAISFVIKGEPGTRFELEWIKLIQPLYAGYCRKEFTLPEGKIWRAIANVGSMNYRNWYGRDEMYSQLYINGQKIEREGALDLYFTAPVDIAPYLKPGKNCVGFYGSRISYSPFIYFQTRIIMESGEVITVYSEPTWKYSPEKQEGWSLPGFDDSAWKDDVMDAGHGPWVNARDNAGSMGIPAYSGRLVIKNPGNKDLFYRASEAVVMEVDIPAGLKAKAPQLNYLFGRSDAEGNTSLVKKGTVSTYQETGGSLVYRINLGKQADGIYALALSLKDSTGGVIEERTREPVVVLGELSQKPIAGTGYTEGLDLELEDTIDFTAPQDPHPTRESPPAAAPRIKREGGLVYREVNSGKRGAGFSYGFEFKHPGSFYYLELEYPDNLRRIIEVVIQSNAGKGGASSSQAGVGAETGGRFLPTGKMQTLRWIHVADPGPHTVDIVNAMNGERAAAKSLKIYRIKGMLPALESGTTRSYGIHTERTFYDSGIGKNFGTITLKNGAAAGRGRPGEKLQAESLMQAALKNLNWLKLTGERYVQYLKYTGQNAHIMGCYQYCEYNTPNIFAPPIEDSSILNCPKTVMANLFEVNGIDFYAGVEFSQSQDVKTYANNALLAQGADSAYMVDANGRQIYGFFVSYLQNWLYPATQQKFYSLMQRLGRTFGHLSHFRGIHNFTGIDTRAGGYWMPGMSLGSKYDNPLRISYDDTTFRRFEAETGIQTGAAMTDPKRFSRRAKFLRDNPDARQKFLAWRADKFKEMMAAAVTALRKESRPDVELLNVLQTPDYKLFEYLYRTKKDFKALCAELAYDIDKVNSIPGIWTGRWTIGWRHWYPRPFHRNPYTWIARIDPGFISAFDREINRFVFIRTSWDENKFEGGRIRTLPQPSGYNSREAIIQALITGDPELIVGGYTDLNINVGYEHTLRRVLQPFTYLPKAKFTPALGTGLATNVAIRLLNQKDASYFYLANPGQWSMNGTVTLAGGGEVYDLVTGKRVAAATGELAFTLEPFGLLAYRVTSPALKITAYKTAPLAKEDLARLETAIKAFEENAAAGRGIEPADKRYLKPIIAKINTAIASHEYARAWSLLTEPRVWTLKEKMEKD